MGCDIHLYVEVRQVDGSWKSADEWAKDEDGYVYVPYEKQFYNGRNYDLFAILADVRNGRGFAGIKTGEGFNPISAPRGIPADVSPEVKAKSDDWGGDGHSHSWHTVADLLAFDWTQTTINQGWINGPIYARWQLDPSDPPETYCGGVSGGSIKHVSMDEMKALVAACPEGDYSSLRDTYCLASWGIRYCDAAPYFWSNTIPRLLHLGKPEDVRIVFWFDN